MKSGRVISDRAIVFFFKKDYTTIKHILHPVDVRRRTDIPDARMPTHKRLTKSVGVNQSRDLFDLAARGYVLPPSQPDGGDDIAGDVANGFNFHQDHSLDSKLATMWSQFLIDVMLKAPNPKNSWDASYCLTPEADRHTIKDVFYQDRTLSRVWRVCQYKVASSELWTNTFTRLWPIKGHVLSPSAQNYATCRYYLDWKRFVAEYPSNIVTVAHSALKSRFDHLYWIPAATSDKIWNTKAGRGFVILPNAHRGSAPQILIRTLQKPIWTHNI
jgi:hypothetical protein